MTRALLLPCLLAIACGSDNDDVGAIDTSDAPDPVDSVDTGPVDLGPVTVTVDPPDGFVDVAPLVTPTVTFSRAVDPLSITETMQLELTDGLGRPITVTTTLGAGNVVLTLDPDVPLDRGDVVSFSLSGVTTPDGVVAPAVSGTWTIHGQTPASQFVDRVARLGEIYQLDDRGVLLGFDRFQVGPSGVFPSPTDVQVARRADTRLADGRLDLHEYFDSAGLDGEFGTADDVLDRVFDVELADSVETRTNVRVGADGVLGTSDDTTLVREQVTFDAQGRLLNGIASNGAGTDGQWFTADDVSLFFFDVARDPGDGQITEIRYFAGAGPDQVLFTPDDLVGGYERRQYNGDRRLVAVTLYELPGLDDVWFTADDVVFRREVWNWNSRGLLSQRYVFVGPGPDLTWETGVNGDDIGTLRRFGYSGNDINSRQTINESYGDDGEWNTQDDVIQGYFDLEFDDNGLWTRALWHDDPGVGELWFDDDDPVVQEIVYGSARAAGPPNGLFQPAIVELPPFLVSRGDAGPGRPLVDLAPQR